MTPFEEATIGSRIESAADLGAEPIADLIAGERGHEHARQEDADRHRARGGENAGDDEEAVAGQEEAEEETAFGEHDRDHERQRDRVISGQ